MLPATQVLGALHGEVGQLGRETSLLVGEAHAHIPLLAGLVLVLGHLLAIHEGAHHPRHGGGAHAQVRGGLAVHHQPQLGLAAVQTRSDVDGPGHGAQGLLHQGDSADHGLPVRGLHGDHDGGLLAEVVDGAHGGLDAGHSPEGFPELAPDRDVVGPAALLQLHVDVAGVDGPVEARADGGVGQLHAGGGLDDGLDGLGLLSRGLEAGAGLGLEAHCQVAAVVVGHEVVAEQPDERHGQHPAAEADPHDGPPVPEGPLDGGLVGNLPAVQYPAESLDAAHDGVGAPVVDVGIGAALVLGIRPDGAEHGIQGEAHEE